MDKRGAGGEGTGRSSGRVVMKGWKEVLAEEKEEEDEEEEEEKERCYLYGGVSRFVSGLIRLLFLKHRP